MVAADREFCALALDFDRVRIGKLRRPLKDGDAIPPELCTYHFRLSRNDRLHTEGEVLHRDLSRAAIAIPIKRLHRQPGQLTDGFADAFAWNSTRVHAYAAHHEGAVDYCHALAQLRCTDGPFLTGWAAAKNDQVKLLAHLSNTLAPIEMGHNAMTAEIPSPRNRRSSARNVASSSAAEAGFQPLPEAESII